MSKCSKCLTPSDSETHTTLPSVPVWTECEACGVLYESDAAGVPIDSGSISMGGIHEEITRPMVRVMVEKQNARLRKIAEEGGNVYQASTDYLDWLTEVYSASMTDEEKLKFWDLHAQEQEALTRHIQDNTARVEAETAELLKKHESAERTGEQIGMVIGAALLITIVLFLFSKM
ncbi:hypothetical protein [Vreelandella populi]|uniref:Uncharacterized protein n=1 Tax=Vreelandella populi TaxID=2498858 RepID=A0A433LFL4_9GAMM|nr:hypothetical protein [Halomonas populi]RUR48789.1 hypothetical protein ELY37_02765 [Halomonas populi]